MAVYCSLEGFMASGLSPIALLVKKKRLYDIWLPTCDLEKWRNRGQYVAEDFFLLHCKSI